jgi:hypothetical protein
MITRTARKHEKKFRMCDADNYIVCGDRIIAVPRSTRGDSIHGRVLQILGDDIGRREFVCEREGTHWLSDGAIGLPENLYIFEVERGDAWVVVPPYLLPEVAESKAERSVNNARKRSAKKTPLFASQIEVERPDVASMIARVAANRREKLERDDEQARRSTELRAEVECLINPDQFAVLKSVRSRFPRSAVNGLYFWQKQLRQIKETGKPDIDVLQPIATDRLSIEWLRPDRELIWLSSAGPKQVRVSMSESRLSSSSLLGNQSPTTTPETFHTVLVGSSLAFCNLFVIEQLAASFLTRAATRREASCAPVMTTDLKMQKSQHMCLCRTRDDCETKEEVSAVPPRLDRCRSQRP